MGGRAPFGSPTLCSRVGPGGGAPAGPGSADGSSRPLGLEWNGADRAERDHIACGGRPFVRPDPPGARSTGAMAAARSTVAARFLRKSSHGLCAGQE